MNVNHFELKKTAMLFFDILNGYVPDPEPGKPRVLKKWIENAVRPGKAARAAGLPVFFAKGNHRPDTRPRLCSSPTRITLSFPGRRAK